MNMNRLVLCLVHINPFQWVLVTISFCLETQRLMVGVSLHRPSPLPKTCLQGCECFLCFLE